MRLHGLVLGLTLATVGAQSAYADTIRTALAAAYNHNATLNAQRAATRAVDEGLPQARAGNRPTITGNADYGFSHTSNNLTGNTSLNPYGFGITISQSIFDGFQTQNRIGQAEASIRGSREQLRRVEQTILQNAAQAYVDVLGAQEIVSIRRRNIEFLSEQLRSSQARLDVGEGTRTDVAQSQARLGAARATLTAAQANLTTAEATYFQVIGRRPKNLSWPKGPTRLYARSLQSGLTIAANEHPAVLLTKHAVDAAAFDVKAQEGALLPSVTLNGNASRRYNSTTDGSRTNSASATVNLSVPIYQGGRVSSLVRQKKQTLAQTRIQVDEARDQVRAAVISSWSSLQAARANVTANQGTLRAARLALSGVIEERNVGQRTQLEVLDAQSTVLESQVALVNARTARVSAGYGLVSSIGRLNSRRLGLPVRHYQPKKHYKAVKDLWFGLRTPSGR